MYMPQSVVRDRHLGKIEETRRTRMVHLAAQLRKIQRIQQRAEHRRERADEPRTMIETTG